MSEIARHGTDDQEGKMVDYYQDKAGGWRFRVKGENGEIQCTSEAYASKSNARRGVRDLKETLNRAPIL